MRYDAEATRELLKAKLEKEGIGPYELAPLVGLKSKNPIGNFVNGHSKSLSIETLARIARYFDCALTDLVVFYGEASNLPVDITGRDNEPMDQGALIVRLLTQIEEKLETLSSAMREMAEAQAAVAPAQPIKPSPKRHPRRKPSPHSKH